MYSLKRVIYFVHNIARRIKPQRALETVHFPGQLNERYRSAAAVPPAKRLKSSYPAASPRISSAGHALLLGDKWPRDALRRVDSALKDMLAAACRGSAVRCNRGVTLLWRMPVDAECS